MALHTAAGLARKGVGWLVGGCGSFMSPHLLPHPPQETSLEGSWLEGRTGGPLGGPTLESELEALGKLWEANAHFSK